MKRNLFNTPKLKTSNGNKIVFQITINTDQLSYFKVNRYWDKTKKKSFHN